jgi:hypothetical protein
MKSGRRKSAWIPDTTALPPDASDIAMLFRLKALPDRQKKPAESDISFDRDVTTVETPLDGVFPF